MTCNYCLLLAIVGVVCPLSAAQNFEVASIRKSPPPQGNSGTPAALRPNIAYTPGGLAAINYSVRRLLAEAYQLPSRFVSEGRDVSADLLDQPYSVTAKSERAESKASLQFMLRALLADRFQLSFHREPRQVDIYRLVVRKQEKMERSSAKSEKPHYVRRDGLIYLQDATAATFCEMLERFMGRPVWASSELSGLYNFPLPGNANVSDEGKDDILNLLRQFGLNLVKDRSTVDYLIVDHVSPASEN